MCFKWILQSYCHIFYYFFNYLVFEILLTFSMKRFLNWIFKIYVLVTFCRYPVIPTLLTRIFWWRICLDEAQMVESNAAAATEMALRLYAKHRWCITGTPIQRKLDDLYGLLRFLKSSPFNNSRWWIDVLRDPYEVWSSVHLLCFYWSGIFQVTFGLLKLHTIGMFILHNLN